MNRQLTTPEKIHILRNAARNTATQLAVRLKCPLSLVTTYIRDSGLDVKKEKAPALVMPDCTRAHTFNKILQSKHEL